MLFNLAPAWLFVAWTLFISGVIVRALRWQSILEQLGVHRSLVQLTGWYLVGGFFNVLLPTGFGGDAVRAAELAQDTGRPAAVVNSVVVDRYLGIMVLLAMGLAVGLARPGTAPAATLLVTMVLFVGGLAAAWLARTPVWAAVARGTGVFAVTVRRLRLQDVAESFAPYRGPAILRGLLASLVFNVLQIGWNMALAHGLGLRLPVTVFATLVPLTAVALLLPTFGGLGVRELSYVGLFGTVGVAQPAALALSLGVYIITVATGLIGGVLYLVHGVRQVKRA